jgi:diguanylate cyclase (GGDEF)-like protein
MLSANNNLKCVNVNHGKPIQATHNFYNISDASPYFNHCILMLKQAHPDGDMYFMLLEGTLANNLGLSTKAVLGKRLDDVLPSRICEWLALPIQNAVQGETVEVVMEWETKSYFIAFSPVQGKPGTIAGTVIDVTARMNMERLLYEQASVDSLTTLPNRNYFMNQLKDALLRAQERDYKVAILFIDLDRFKEINDTRGHAVGDKLLQKVAMRLSDSVREKDCVARIGGDEFVIFAEDTTYEEVTSISQNIISKMSEGFNIDGDHIHISPSIGISLYPDDDIEPTILVNNADIAMYYVKGKGSNNYHYFTDELKKVRDKKIKLERDVIHRFDMSQLVLYFVPRLNSNTGYISGIETVLYWDHPELGLLEAQHFIPLLKSTTRLKEIDEWVIRGVSEQIMLWEQVIVDNYPITIPISSVHLTEAFVELLVKETSMLNKHSIEIHINESVLCSTTSKEVICILNEVRYNGFAICVNISDFGKSIEALSYLEEMTVSRMKVNAKQISELSKRNEAILKTMIAFSQHLDIALTIDGVETAELYHYLSHFFTLDVQGDYISAPLLPRDMDNYLHWHANTMKQQS